MTQARSHAAARPNGAWPVAAVLTLLLGLWLLRMFTAAYSGAGLFVDEAQYWEWSRELAWGYYSKPPLLPVLIKLSVWVAGDSPAGVRWLVQLCWAVVPLVLWRLGWEMQRDSQHTLSSPHAIGAWAAVLFASSLVSGVLGQVATTDGPLILFWALQLWLMWRALAQAENLSRWLLVGLVLALGVLSKYTMSAVLVSWVLWWLAHRTTVVSKGMVLAAGVAALAMLPHLAWNQAHDWPTLKHTADLLSDGHDSIPQSMVAVTLRLGEYVASQCLLAGPVLWVMALLGLSRWVVNKKNISSSQASPAVWALHASWPLWTIGAFQAMQGTAQINWPAPALLGGCVALAWLLAAGQTHWRWRGLVLAVVISGLLTSAVSLGGDWRARLGLPVQKSKWDLWGRARGWQEALQPFETMVAQHPEAVLVALDRTLIVHSAYAWREQHRLALSWQQSPQPLHHYDLLYRFDPATHTEPVLLLVMGELPAFVRAKYKHVQRLSDPEPAGRALFLWLLKDPLP